MIGSALDNLISVFSPQWAMRRVAQRNILTRVRAESGDHSSMRQMLGGRNQGGYEAGKSDRLKGCQIGSTHENDVPHYQINRLRYRAWNLYRNNPQARKICRTLCAKVIGRGLSPQPQATLTDGAPHVEFRKRARQVWEEFTKEADFRGKPGRGGQHFTALSKTVFRSVILSGGTLYRFRHADRSTQRRDNLYVPLQIQLLHIDRLDALQHGTNKFYGIEVDNDGRAITYHVLKNGQTLDTTSGPVPLPEVSGDGRSVPIPAAQMGHLFAEEDIDQLLGSPWFGAALLTMDDRRNYEYSELIAAEMGSCIVAGYRRSSGQDRGLSLADPSGDVDLTDADGNPVTHLQPGMFLDLGANGEIQMVNPQRPNSNSEGFIAHLVRSEAVSMPGVKSSTLTGDYRNSSFSSERSADNDIWPEIEEIQDWFSAGFCQPIYDEVIATAVASGLFDKVKGFSVADFNVRKREYLKTNWQGPVPRSINPKDDAAASGLRVKNATSSPQRECAKEGRDWREILQEVHEFIAYAGELEIPEEIWRQALGMQETQTETESVQEPTTEPAQDAATAMARIRSTGFAALNSAGTL